MRSVVNPLLSENRLGKPFLTYCFLLTHQLVSLRPKLPVGSGILSALSHYPLLGSLKQALTKYCCWSPRYLSVTVSEAHFEIRRGSSLETPFGAGLASYVEAPPVFELLLV